MQWFFPFPAKWLREHLEYDLYTDMSNITCPVLTMTGTKDAQTDYRTLQKVKELIPNVDIYELENVNHMLKDQEEPIQMKKLLKYYLQNIDKPISTKVKNILEKWLASFSK
ncbi:alpha/beta fold hydrolase [Salirhabdus salicampi]|uniref:alpha/beta fold hydrolase n=1 Tax=Salirhabdus salicampi TaxID=476102 RepID=UPI0020C2333A|nr:alpha/beta hydrolase [Salirhabdus salicampi]MCP8615720.1 alpha/beta hydrolase [Salirhabdus salicampi]